jgi:hypothetical protein
MWVLVRGSFFAKTGITSGEFGDMKFFKNFKNTTAPVNFLDTSPVPHRMLFKALHLRERLFLWLPK